MQYLETVFLLLLLYVLTLQQAQKTSSLYHNHHHHYHQSFYGNAFHCKWSSVHMYLKLGDFEFVKLTFSLCLPTVFIPFTYLCTTVAIPWHLKFLHTVCLCFHIEMHYLPTSKCYAHFCSTYRTWLSAEITDIRSREEKPVCPVFICILCFKCTYHKLLTVTSQSCNFLPSFLILYRRIYYRIMFMYLPPL